MESYSQLSHTSSRTLAMMLALVSAVVLSPLYMDHRKSEGRVDGRWSSGGLVLPVVVGGLILAIRSTAGSSKSKGPGDDEYAAGWVLRIGSSSWGLAGILMLLLFVISWQGSVQQFFWR